MTQLATEYHPEVFASLPSFSDAKDRLERERDKIRGLGDVICRHRLHDRLGVNLLHSHFDLFSNEQLVKRRDKQRNEAYISPTKIEPNRRAYSYRIPSNSDGSFEPLEFFARPASDCIPPLDDVIDDTPDFLDEFAQQAHRLDVADLFGLAVLQTGVVEISEDELRLETTDSDKRLLTIGATSRADVDPTAVTQTVWGFTPPDCDPASDDVFAPSRCVGHCVDHCYFHCESHCHGHCEDH